MDWIHFQVLRIMLSSLYNWKRFNLFQCNGVTAPLSLNITSIVGKLLVGDNCNYKRAMMKINR